MAITQSVVDAIAERMDGETVTQVCLEIGTLSGIVPESVRFCFDVACAGTNLEGARLEVLQLPGEAWCRGCAERFKLDDLIPLCPCGSADVEIFSGRELKIKSVEVL